MGRVIIYLIFLSVIFGSIAIVFFSVVTANRRGRLDREAADRKELVRLEHERRAHDEPGYRG